MVCKKNLSYTQKQRVQSTSGDVRKVIIDKYVYNYVCVTSVYMQLMIVIVHITVFFLYFMYVLHYVHTL